MDRKDDERSRLQKENAFLIRENSILKQLLHQHDIPIPNIQHTKVDKMTSAAKQAIINHRIRVFKNLFRGRDDVFAVRWEYAGGKTGYSPVRKRGGEQDDYLPITDKDIYNHLLGKKTIGIYPMLKNETCWFLAIDFDKENWKKDIQAFIEVCKKLRVPTSVERSRSGNGGHVWIFFDEPLPAETARRLGNRLLSDTINNRYEIGMDSYDRMFPNQDTMPKGGFGNLIALPLQGQSRKQNNSVFLDEEFNAQIDQWTFLAGIKKMSLEEVDIITKSFIGKENSTKYEKESSNTTEVIPEKLTIEQENGIFIPIESLPSSLINKFIRLATFNNPAFFKAEANRLSTYKTPRMIDCSDRTETHLILPRGCLEDLKKLCEEVEIELIIKDKTNQGTPIDVDFYGRLLTLQEEAVENLFRHQTGILSATTGFGKTVVAANLIARRKVNTLIIVHTKQLVDQWTERLSSFLKLDKKAIGQIGGGKHKPNGIIDVATIQTLNYKGIVKDIVEDYGQVIVDECHHISAFSFEKVLKKVRATYVHGLTATPNRKDGLQRIMKMQCGDVCYKVSAKDQAKVRPFMHVLVPRKTSFKSKLSDKEVSVQAMYSEMLNDTKRNELIFNDVLKELEKGAAPIILTERVEHVQYFKEKFQHFAKNIIVLTGSMKKSELTMKYKQLAEIPDHEERLIIATGQYIGEGFDNAVLDVLFLTMPISWKGTLEQYVGRLHRLHDNKDIVKVYDYIDHREEAFRNMYSNRKKGYRSMGYVIQNNNLGQEDSSEQMRLF